MIDTAHTWNFAVIGRDSNDCPKYLGFARTLEEATKLLRNMENLGWRRAAVFDSALREVKDATEAEKP